MRGLLDLFAALRREDGQAGDPAAVFLGSLTVPAGILLIGALTSLPILACLGIALGLHFALLVALRFSPWRSYWFDFGLPYENEQHRGETARDVCARPGSVKDIGAGGGSRRDAAL